MHWHSLTYGSQDKLILRCLCGIVCLHFVPKVTTIISGSNYVSHAELYLLNRTNIIAPDPKLRSDKFRGTHKRTLHTTLKLNIYLQKKLFTIETTQPLEN